MDVKTLMLVLAGLAAWGTAYAVWLSLTPAGRAFNAAPEIQPFLTAIGLLPVIAGIGVVWGWHYAAQFAVMLVAVGGAFIVRGLYRLAHNYVAESNAREKANAYARQIAGRD